MWNEILSAFALMMVLEGLLPFLNPAQMRQSLLAMAKMDDATLRLVGLLSMLTGVVFLYLVH